MSFNMISMHERIHRRSGHIAVVYKKWLLVWGGYMERELEGLSEQEYHYTDELWSYSCDTELWERVLTRGDIPRPVCGSCGVLLGDQLYVFGGYVHDSDEQYEGHTSELRRLDLRTMTWRCVLPEGQAPTACDKLAGWAHDGKVYFFGGFGPRPSFRAGFSFLWNHFNNQGNHLQGWNNQLVAYDPAHNMWEWPRVAGPAPTPRAAHAADVSGDKAYIFGGRFLNKRMNDLYCLDLAQMRWSHNLSEESTEIPEGRSWHSFTFVTPDKAVIYGGLSNKNSVLRDCWVLDVGTLRWRRVGMMAPRYWHTARMTATKELLCIGGDRVSHAASVKDHADEMVVFEFAPRSLLRLCVAAVMRTVPPKHWLGPHALPQSLEALLRQRWEQDRGLQPLAS